MNFEMLPLSHKFSEAPIFTFIDLSHFIDHFHHWHYFVTSLYSSYMYIAPDRFLHGIELDII